MKLQMKVHWKRISILLGLLVIATVGLVLTGYPRDVGITSGNSSSRNSEYHDPSCTLAVGSSYVHGTLSVKFTIGASVPTTVNIWMTAQNDIIPIVTSQPVPATDPPATYSKDKDVSLERSIGVLATLTTPEDGIVCSSWETVDVHPTAETESEDVQQAMYEMMEQTGVETITPHNSSSDVATNNWIALPVESPTDPGAEPLAKYLLMDTTLYFYCYDATGQLTLQDKFATGC